MNIFTQIDTMLSKNKDKKFFISDLTERTLTYKDLNDNASKFTSYFMLLGEKSRLKA